MSEPTTPPEAPPEDLVDTAGIAKMLRINPQSVRNAYRRAVRRAGDPSVPTQEAERDAALRDAFPTPGGRLRWTKDAAARILRAFNPAAPALSLVVAVLAVLLVSLGGCIGAPFVAERVDVKKAPTSSASAQASSSTSSSTASSGTSSSTGGSSSSSSSDVASSSSGAGTGGAGTGGAASASAVSSSGSSSSESSSSSSGTTCTSPCGVDADCADVGTCEVASCEAGCCTTTTAPAGTPCDNHDPCTDNDACDGKGTCVSGPLSPPTYVPAAPAYPTGYPGGFCVMEGDYCSTMGTRSIPPPAGYFTGPPSPTCDQNGQRAGVNYAEFFCKACVGDCATSCP